MTEQTTTKKLRVGWFSFSCCEDSTVVMTELLNDHWQEWKKFIDFRHARVLKSHNVMDEMDVAFVEGAIASQKHMDELKEIRAKAKKIVAIGACAVVGMPSGQRNQFDEKTWAEIQHLIDRFKHLPKVLKVADVVTVDASVGGCPMNPDQFLAVVSGALEEFGVVSKK
ncbi:hypothetical protein A3C91_02685 [Candidatus Azambacteria bacterium RIFCSPHIGHO2_02_FULL_52_12]|uniref:NADH:ubiquinone oxidoreductase-like 20kDa subunit domain-containing protein n=1 Tax=Candidatus Azambacteria bacterium RIFCSPLOWO2_01_FULL_46_25 TaxID=1797298 RepID=A0A1F5BTG9_9BACT|nr:MAG: hypothetical protein A3C91_02685 [Candidatus Azambacteria bacterium RIFCSPHIGHO2_02_FULL_52_12]OGD33917.1 MAG: hypothetical protein A2988_00280 [Candidatus Azambacteria bacterium RIFCSPLOWO2_01_FULL_46_25]OGD37138.1 MAG: hypothetical protein A2850_04170 [Candidatus Azambacteria bacterium RIFCSPHIGHO2_01_FULL_51_74]